MAPPKFEKAVKAMRSFGYSEETVGPILQNLRSRKLTWKVIEYGNYSLLVDEIEKELKAVVKQLQNLSDDEFEVEEPLIKSKGKCQTARSSPRANATLKVYQETSGAKQSVQDIGSLSREVKKITYPSTRQAINKEIEFRDADICYLGSKKGHCSHKSSSLLKPIWETNLLTSGTLDSGTGDTYLGYPSVKMRRLALEDCMHVADCEDKNFTSDVCLSSEAKFPSPLAMIPQDESGSSGTNLLLQMMNVDDEYQYEALFGSPCEEGAHLEDEPGCSNSEYMGKSEIGNDGNNNEARDGFSTPSHLMIIESERPYFIEDITQGVDKEKISLINEVNSEELPTFNYMLKSIAYYNADNRFPLAHVNNCCSSCTGDCLSSGTPCPCAKKSGGEFAYGTGGVVKDEFIEECINLNHKSPQQKLSFCEVCPLERSKRTLTGKCKGHVTRKFIKECWFKCGCCKTCGNRTVQGGIKAKLQVFMTSEGKGWGLRTLEDLPRGAFVCEYVGEILTSKELLERNMKNMDMQHTYYVVLDADWRSSRGLKDKEALCLDGASYGNVARFINHRCHDANMIEIPVEVETPDHYYYHVAFFTTREVKAMEELNWDYGIDFSNDTQPHKVFQCRCRGDFCRGKSMVKSHDTSATEPCSDSRRRS